VDGQAYQIAILTPTIIGIIVPTVSVLFGTLVSTSVSTLRSRQMEIRSKLNEESCDIRILESAITSMRTDVVEDDVAEDQAESEPVSAMRQQRLLGYLEDYVTRIISESRPGVDAERLEYVGAADSEMSGVVIELHDAVRHPLASAQPGLSQLIGEALGIVGRLNGNRSARISALQSSYPPIHFGILMLLGGSIVMVFLIESDQEVLAFLTAIQLKLLFSVIVGVMASTAFLLGDLSDPFRGSYCITPATSQLFTIRDAMAVDRMCAPPVALTPAPTETKTNNTADNIAEPQLSPQLDNADSDESLRRSSQAAPVICPDTARVYTPINPTGNETTSTLMSNAEQGGSDDEDWDFGGLAAVERRDGDREDEGLSSLDEVQLTYDGEAKGEEAISMQELISMLRVEDIDLEER